MKILKSFLRIALIVIAAAVVAVAGTWFFGQQLLVQTVASTLLARYGLQVQVEAFSLSLYRETLTAREITVVGPDDSRVRVSGLALSFSLPQALRGELVFPSISIDRLESRDAQKIGSAFSSPEPESETNDALDIVLPLTLGKGEIRSAQLSENFGSDTRVEIEESSWSLATTPSRGLTIRETIRNGRLFLGSEPPLHLGDLEGSQWLEGDRIVLRDLRLTSGIADLSTAEVTLTPDLTGTFTVRGELARIPGVPAGITSALDGVVTLSGTLSDPQFGAVVESSAGVLFDGVKRLDTAKLEGRYRGLEDGYELIIAALDARGDAGTFSIHQPLVLRNGTLGGEIAVDLSDLRLESIGFSAFAGTARFAGALEAPQVDARFNVADLTIGPLSFGVLEVTSRYDHVQNGLVLRVSEPLNPFGEVLLESVVTFSQPATQVTKLSFERKLRGENLRIKGSVEGSGRFTTESIRGSAALTGEYIHNLKKFPFAANATIEHGSVRGSLAQESVVAGTYTLTLDSTKPSSLRLSVTQPQLSRWSNHIACGSVNLEVNLEFPLNDPRLARGVVHLPEASFGCDRLAVTVGGPPLRIEGPKLFVDAMNVKSQAGELLVRGRASPEMLDLQMSGKLDLSFAGQINSFVNDVGGTAAVEVRVTGAPSDPDLHGEIVLSDLAAAIPNPLVEVEEVGGKIVFSGDTISIVELKGGLNEGIFSLAGQMKLSDPLATITTDLSLQNVSLHPTQDAEVWVSSDLTVRPKAMGDSSVPSIAGTITINDGLLEKQFDQAFIRERIRTWLQSNSVRTPYESEVPAFPEFDLKVVGESSFAVKTNIARADLSPSLAITGNPKDLRVRGQVGIASGSFDVGRTHFEVITGKVSMFGSPMRLELFAEGEAKDENGFPVTVTMELSGDATDPRVTLTSDNGLSQEEIVKLLAAGGGLGGQSLFDQAVSAAGLSEIGLLTEDSWINAITGVDDLSIEPSYDLATGRTSSRVHATKQLTDEIGLVAQFPFTGTGQSTISALYDVSPLLGIALSYRPPNSAFKASMGADLNWTIVSPYKRWPLQIEGNEAFTSVTLMNALGLSRRSRMSLERLPVIERKLRRFYHERGYLDVTVVAQCLDGCAFARVDIVEGPQFTIGKVAMDGDLNMVGTRVEKPSELEGSPATKSTLLDVQRSLITSHRKGGYYRARIVVRYERVANTKQVQLSVKGWKRQRNQFTLDGNRSFPSIAFEKALRLNEQSFPFGPGLPGEFITAVEQYYLERGYADLRITSTLADTGDLISLHLAITEGERFAAEGVEVIGSPVSLKELKKLVAGGDAETIFEPPVLYRAAVQFGRREIEAKLRSNGYPEAVVEAEEIRIRPGRAKIRYSVSAGAPQLFSLTLEGLPEGVEAPQVDKASSLEILQRETERLKERVSRAGFRSANVALATDPANSTARIVIEPGVRDTISEITIVGNEQVDAKVIRSALALEPGMPLSVRSLAQARNRLLKRGLFSEVSVTPDPTTHAVTVAVRERLLRTLGVTTGYDSVFGIHLGVNAIDRAFLSDGRELSFRSDLYYDYADAQLGRGFGAFRFRDLDLWEETAWSEEAGLSNVQESSIQEFDLTTLYLRSELEHRFSPKYKGRFGHVAELLRTSEVPEDIILSDLDTGSYVASSLTGALEYVDQDDPLIPRYARKVGVATSLTHSAFGSDADYLLLQPSVLLLQPTGLFEDRLSFLLSGAAGLGIAFGGTDELPLAKRYRLGGQDSVRGYRMNSLGPRSAAGNVIGGDRFYQGSAELRYEVVDRVQLLTFLDLGSVWLDSIKKQRIDFGTGVGVRYSSPIGSLGADVGVPINPRDGSQAPEFYLRLGAAF